MEIKTLEIAGFYPALKSMRLPHKSEGDSTYTNCIDAAIPATNNEWYNLGPKDLSLAQKLVKAGPSHAKFTRGIRVWVEITGPWYFFNEFVTYTCGNEPLSSTSSMHIDCKGLTGKELQKAKGEIRGNYEYTRIDSINYQCLRNMYFQRKTHRLPEWHEFCSWIEQLPLAKELITVE